MDKVFLNITEETLKTLSLIEDIRDMIKYSDHIPEEGIKISVDNFLEDIKVYLPEAKIEFIINPQEGYIENKNTGETLYFTKYSVDRVIENEIKIVSLQIRRKSLQMEYEMKRRQDEAVEIDRARMERENGND